MKKMRKLIPAFAMLMVAAIMMTTASFAWFTMNDTVTATGMQIQAIATGSLVIGNAPLTSSDNLPSVDFATGVTELRPVTFNETTNKWQIAAGNTVDQFTGKTTATLTDLTSGQSGYYLEKVVYIGSAGDAITDKTLQITLDAPVVPVGTASKPEVAHKAYSVAIYLVDKYAVDGTTINPAWGKDNAGAENTVAVEADPDAVLHVDSIAGRNTVTFTTTKSIPSVAGIENDPVGLKVIMRVYVDGALEALVDGATDETSEESFAVKTRTETVYTPVTSEIAANKVDGAPVYRANRTYFTDANGQVPANITEYEDGDAIPTTWYFKDSAERSYKYNYVNTSQVPSASATLRVSFALAAVPTP